MILAIYIFGWDSIGPIFCGARLLNGQGLVQRSMKDTTLLPDRKRHARRAAGPAYGTFAAPTSRIVAKGSGSIAAPPWSQRLGARVGVAALCSRTRLRPCWLSQGHSGASPHQSFGSGIALGVEQSSGLIDRPPLMTKIKTFVPYFKYLVVLL
jgi:hypothetical protein